jgi:hypothetical protein
MQEQELDELEILGRPVMEVLAEDVEGLFPLVQVHVRTWRCQNRIRTNHVCRRPG